MTAQVVFLIITVRRLSLKKKKTYTKTILLISVMAVGLLVSVEAVVVVVAVEESLAIPVTDCGRNTGTWTSSPSLRKTSISSIQTLPGGLMYV